MKKILSAATLSLAALTTPAFGEMISVCVDTNRPGGQMIYSLDGNQMFTIFMIGSASNSTEIAVRCGGNVCIDDTFRYVFVQDEGREKGIYKSVEISSSTSSGTFALECVRAPKVD